MKNLVIILILFSATTVIAKRHTCDTRTVAIEDRYVELCTIVRQFHQNPTPWTDRKCATWLFEQGMRGTQAQLDNELIKRQIRQAQKNAYDKIRLDYDGATPIPTPTPTATPTATPTPTP